jgi:hypothetical protein
MLPGYVDEHVDRRITEGLRRRGMGVGTAQEHNQRNTDDAILLATATAEGRLMLTCDVDFLRLHHEWMATGKNHAGILFWPQRLRIGEAVRRIFDYATSTDPADAVNTLTYL